MNPVQGPGRAASNQRQLPAPALVRLRGGRRRRKVPAPSRPVAIPTGSHSASRNGRCQGFGEDGSLPVPRISRVISGNRARPHCRSASLPVAGPGDAEAGEPSSQDPRSIIHLAVRPDSLAPDPRVGLYRIPWRPVGIAGLTLSALLCLQGSERWSTRSTTLLAGGTMHGTFERLPSAYARQGRMVGRKARGIRRGGQPSTFRSVYVCISMI